MTYRVEQAADQSWRVVDATGKVVASGLTNEEAWQVADREDRVSSIMEEARLRIAGAFSK
jgi:hypothetical protein